MTQLGGDVDQIEALAGVFERAAGELRRAGQATTSAMGSVWWFGPDAVRTRTWWRTTARAGVQAATEQLDGAARDLRRQAQQQRTASGATGIVGLGPSGPIGPIGPVVAPYLPEIGRWLEARGRDAGEWFGDRWNDLQTWGGQIADGVDDVTDGEEDDDEGQSRGFGIPGPFDDWARDGAESVVDRGSTMLDYAVRTADRRIEHPIQTLVDVASGTAFAEDVTAGLQIGVGDAEIVDTPYGNDAVFLTNAWAPFEGGAITIGHTVSVNSTAPPSPSLIDHEMQHVYDVEDVGGLGFYGSYGADWVWNYVVEGKTGPNEAYEDVFWEQRGYGTGPNSPHDEPEGILGGIWKDLWTTR